MKEMLALNQRLRFNVVVNSLLLKTHKFARFRCALMATCAMILCTFAASAAWSQTPLVLDVGYDSIETGQHLEYLEDMTGELSPQEIAKRSPEIQWKPIAGPVATVGYTDAVVWFRPKSHISLNIIVSKLFYVPLFGEGFFSLDVERKNVIS